MKQLFRNLWEGPASTFAGAISAGLAVVVAADIEMPVVVNVLLLALTSILGFFSGPKTPPLS